MTDLLREWGEPIKFHRKQAFEFIPTWQRGQEQPHPNDFGRYQSEGYPHSLIYSCIEEIATSFADLPAQVLNQTRDGTFDEIPDHEVAALLESPNDTMDASEFKGTIAAYHRATGNVYIEKVRQSQNQSRNRAFSRVKELGVIRSDYVEIKPAATRADDLFLVKVEGRVVRSIPRRDMIHIKTRNLGNDFYGLSPIAVVAKEADLDTWMTDFDLAFFRNAGVPMGLLITKTRHTDDEITQIKGRFRRAFNGLKKWFEVLVINSDEADYKPLAGMPKDMEMVSTREQQEARICSVFGVPPIIVGAAVGLKHATYSNYEQAQQSFWSETMSPFASSIASAFTRELLSEYVTTSTRRAKVAYDLSGVKALQEDNTERLKGVAALITTGGFTVNQALELHGLSSVDTGDFYVRTVAQVVEVPVVAQVNGRRAAGTLRAPIKAVDLNERIRDNVVNVFGQNVQMFKQPDPRGPRERLADRAIAAIAKFLTEQGSRIAGRAKKQLMDGEDDALEAALRPFYEAAAKGGWTFASTFIDQPADFDITDPFVRVLLAGAGDRIKDINAETQRIVQDILQQGRDEGLSIRQVAERIRESGAFDKARAEKIARTELAIADNKGAIQRYDKAGIKSVRIIDGPECGWTDHNDGDLADGSIRTLEEADEFPTSHPNCVRSVIPIFEEG